MHKIGLSLAALLLALLASAADARAEGASGLLQVCRVAEAGDARVGRAIEIPTGATFGDSGSGSERRGAYWPLWLVTTAAMTIAADAQCGTITARITTNLDQKRLRVTDGRWFKPSPGQALPRDTWPGNLSLGATAMGDFR